MVNAAFPAVLPRGGVLSSAFADCQCQQCRKEEAGKPEQAKQEEPPEPASSQAGRCGWYPCLLHSPALLCLPCEQCGSAVQQGVCVSGEQGCVFCVSSVVCTWAMHEGFVSHTCSTCGWCSARSSTPGCHCTPPTACSNPAQQGCCHGQLQLSGDEVPCWGASQSGCCAAGFCLQS